MHGIVVVVIVVVVAVVVVVVIVVVVVVVVARAVGDVVVGVDVPLSGTGRHASPENAKPASQRHTP